MQTEAAISREEFERFRELIHRETGIWLADHKRQLLHSRLSRRLNELGVGCLSEYYDLLEHHDPAGDELRLAINRITTNKTEFFRERAQFDVLRDQVLAGRRKSRLRIWSAACSTGEEPYSLAITLAETIGMGDWKILASDIDTDVLTAAAQAIYEEDRLTCVPMPLLRKYFLRGKGEFQGKAKVKADLRNRVEFRRINLAGWDWPKDTAFDAIFCRNVLIYFDARTQQHVTERLLERLDGSGFLFLGHSESLPWTVNAARVAHSVYRPLPREVS